MLLRKQNIIELSEKNFSVENLMKLFEDNRVHFPQEPEIKKPYSENLARLVGAVEIGIPMPVILASELQNGDFLILETGDQLQILLRYIRGDFSVYLEGLSKREIFFRELADQNARLSSMLLRTVFTLRIIDYRTPKYLHMEVGLFHEKWNREREQAVRDALYRGAEIDVLRSISKEIAYYRHNRSLLENEYTTLYIMLFWGVYKNELQITADMCEQELLEAVINELYDMRYVWLDFSDVVSLCFGYFYQYGRRELHHTRSKDTKYNEKVFGLLVCFYDMCGMCQYTHRETDKILCELFENKSFINRISSMKITVKDIDDMIFYGKDFIR